MLLVALLPTRYVYLLHCLNREAIGRGKFFLSEIIHLIVCKVRQSLVLPAQGIKLRESFFLSNATRLAACEACFTLVLHLQGGNWWRITQSRQFRSSTRLDLVLPERGS